MEFLNKVGDTQLRREVLTSLATAATTSTTIVRRKLLRTILLNLRDVLDVPHEKAFEAIEKSYGELDPNKGSESKDALRIESIFWELIARGLLYPRFTAVRPTAPEDGWPYIVGLLVVTPQGQKFLERQTASPYHDDWVQKVCAPLRDLPVDIAKRLQDARDCLLAHVLRPAVIMTGLACERTVASVYEQADLANKVSSQLKPGNRPTAKRLLDGLIEVASKTKPRPEGLETLSMHLTDLVRQERNDAGHGWEREFNDAEEVELLMFAAARSISTIWGLRGAL